MEVRELLSGIAVSAPASQTSTHGATVSVSIDGSLAFAGDSYTWALSGNLPGGLTLTNTNTLSPTLTGLITANPGTSFSAVLTLSEVHSSKQTFTASATISWTVTALPPVLTQPGGQTSQEHDTVSLGLSATDPGGYPLSYSASGLPSGLAINFSTGVISGTLASGTATSSPYNVQVTVSNGYASASKTFTWGVAAAPAALPTVTGIALVNDTGTPGDLVTSDPRLYGSLGLADGSPYYLPMQYDLNGDGIYDGTTQTDMMGQFTIDLRNSNLTEGSHTISVRGGRTTTDPMIPTYGAWSTFTFTYTAPILALPVVGYVGLVNDTGTPGDLITFDARLYGSLSLTDSYPYYLPVQYDLNGDGMVDGSLQTDGMGLFNIDLRNSNLTEGSHTISIRGGRTTTDPMIPTYGAWSTFTFTYTVPVVALPVVGNVGLVNDTGTPGDLITSDARISGSLSVADSYPYYLPVQYDLNGDGIYDGTTQTDMMGQFTIDLRNSNLTEGSHTIAIRGGRTTTDPMIPTYGNWSTFTFTYTAPVIALPVVGYVGLVNDTGTPGDLITSDARISGSLSVADSYPYYLPVQYDLNGDGIYDGTTYTDMMGQFTIDLRNSNLTEESHTISIRGGRTTTDPMIPTYGVWSTFTFTYTAPVIALPVVGYVGLVNDTGTPSDLITSDARVRGSLSVADSSPYYLPVQYDLNGDGISDGTTYTDMMGQFTIDLRNSNLTEGSHTISIRGGRTTTDPMIPTYGAWSTFTFTYTAPVIALPAVGYVGLVNDTGTPGDLITSDARIRGTLNVADSYSYYLPVQYDLNGDGIYDGTTYTDMMGQFTIDLGNSNLIEGSHTIAIRGGRTTTDPMIPTYGNWSTFTFTYTAPVIALPVVGYVGLVNDTGTPGDLITSDARVYGSLSIADSYPYYLPVQYDLNGDGIYDGTTQTDMMGQFTIDLRNSNLTEGSHTIAIRGGRTTTDPMIPTYGNWSTFTFTYTAPVIALPVVGYVGLVNDTGTPGDLITSDARIRGSLSVADSYPYYLPVQYDLNSDGIYDGTTQTDMMGQFTIDLRNSNLTEGSHTIAIRGGRTTTDPMIPTYGAWATFTFTYTAPALPVVGTMGLVNDTGTPGDLITTDPRISGSLSVTDASASYLPVQYDADGDGIFEGVTQTDMSGQFTINLASPSLAAGAKTIAVRGGQYLNGQAEPSFGAAFNFSFTYLLPATPPPGNQPNSTPVLQGMQFTYYSQPNGMPITGNLTGTLTDNSPNSTYSLQVDYDGDGVSDTTLSVAVGQVSANLTIPTGMSTTRVRVVETESGTGIILTSAWSVAPWVNSSPPGEGGPGPGGVTPVVVNWDAINQARQDAIDAGIAFDQALVDMQAAVQVIRTTYLAAQQQAENEHVAAITAAEAEYTVAMQLAEVAYNNRIEEIGAAREIKQEEIEDEQEAAKVAAAAENAAELAAAVNAYNQAKLDAEAAYDARQEAADLVYVADLQAANDVYDQAAEEINDTLAAAEAAAAAVHADELAAANLALNNAVGAAETVRANAMVANQAVRDAIVADKQAQLIIDTAQFPSSWTYDVSLVQNDPAVLAAISSANNSFQLAVGLADQAYDSAIDSAEGAYNSAVTAAGDDWDSAWATAELARLNARAAAAAVYKGAVTAATNVYQDKVTKAAATRATDKQDAEDEYNESEAGARETRNGAYDTAWGIYTEAMNGAQTALNSGLAADQTLYSGLMVPIRNAWNTAVTAAGTAFNKSMNDAAEDYQSDMAWNVINIYYNPANLAWNGLQAILNGIYTTYSSAAYLAEYTSYQTAIMTAQMGVSLGLNTQEDVWQATKNLSLWGTQQDLAYTIAQIPGELSYIEQERAAATALANATAGAAFSLASQQLSATELATKAKIDANSVYEVGIAGVERDQAIARAARSAAYMITALNAALVLDNAKVAADKAYAIACAEFQKTYDKAVNVAEYNYAIDVQAAAFAESNALVDADVVQVKAAAVADLATVKASTAANTAYTQAAAAAAVAYVEAAGTAATVYSIAYTSAAKSAATPVIFAQAAAISQQLGGGPDAFLFTQRYSMEKLFEVDAWASQVKDDVAAAAVFDRTQAIAYQADANAQAAADQKQTNADADAAKKALDGDVDAWQTASIASILAADSRAITDIEATKEANEKDAEADRARTEKESTANAKQQRATLTADCTAAILGVAADVLATNLSANAAYNKLVAEAPAAVQRMKAEVAADIQKARSKSANDATVTKAAAARDAKMALTNAKEVMATNVKTAAEGIVMVANQPLSNFQYGNGLGTGAIQWVMGPGLDGAVNFSTGFMDGLFAGAWSAGLGQTGLLSYVNRGSLMYGGGQVTGVVYGIVLGAATGMTCQVSWATQIGNGILAVGTGYGMYEAAPRILNGTASVWDYAAFLPAAGYILGYLNRGCFVAETEIATGWGSVTDASMTVAIPAADSGQQATLSQSWSVEWILLGTGIIMLTAIYRNKHRTQESAELDQFFEELTPDDLSCSPHSTLPPPDNDFTEKSHFSDNLLADRTAPLDVDDTALILQTSFNGVARAADPSCDRPDKTPEAALTPVTSTAVPSRYTSRRRTADQNWQMSPWMTTVMLLLAIGCFWLATPSQSRTGGTPAFAATTTDNTHNSSPDFGSKSQRTLITRRIDQIRPGMRVLADNPELHGQDVSERVIDPDTTRLVTLHQVKPDGHELTVQTLISVDTLAASAIEIWSEGKSQPEHQPWVGNAVDVMLRETLLGKDLDLNLPEMGAEGPAKVIAIVTCPPIEPSSEPGRHLVTSVFRHKSTDVIDLEIQGQDTPIGTTSNHPFWSIDRSAFIPAGELRIGERLKQANGLETQVTRVTPRPKVATEVYNLEVNDQHVYHVGNDGLLVHNTCITIIGRMDDLKRFDKVSGVDTWWLSGIKAEPGKRITWFQNKAWLQEKIARGDRFGIATDPSTLPPLNGGSGLPGYFTRLEYQFLTRAGKEVERFW